MVGRVRGKDGCDGQSAACNVTAASYALRNGAARPGSEPSWTQQGCFIGANKTKKYDLQRENSLIDKVTTHLVSLFYF
jgi:hypothetical protein